MLRLRVVVTLLALCVIACGGSAKVPTSEPEPASVETVGDPGFDTIAPQSVETLGLNANFDDYSDLPEERTMEADLDGDGKNELIGVQNRAGKITLSVSGRRMELPVLYVQVVDLTPEAPGKLIAASGYRDEDDLITIEFFRLTENGLQTLGKVNGNQHFTKVRNGELVHDETNCGQRRVIRWELRDTHLVKVQDEKTGDFDEEQCVACPYVYVHTSRGWTLVGEILRNLRGHDLANLQSLMLPAYAAVDGVLRVRLAEEKRERSFIDEVYLLVDGQRLAPSGVSYELQKRDGAALVLDEGNHIDLVFENVPKDSDIALFARGYYEPVSE